MTTAYGLAPAEATQRAANDETFNSWSALTMSAARSSSAACGVRGTQRLCSVWSIVSSSSEDSAAMLASKLRMRQPVCATARGVTAFYDIDTPVTLAALKSGACEYLTPALIPRYGLYLSFTGGPTLRRLERTYRARAARPLNRSRKTDCRCRRRILRCVFFRDGEWRGDE